VNNNDPFIRYLYSLKGESTGTLAALRRACGQRLAQSRNCQSFTSISTRPADFLTVTLAAQYSAKQINNVKHHFAFPWKGSIGAAWARYCRERDKDQDPAHFYRQRQDALSNGQNTPRPPNIHERFRTLLDAELEVDGTGELAYRLRGLVRMCVFAEVPIDVIQLAYDLRGWRAESRYVQERWAKAFYGSPRPPATSQAQEEKEPVSNNEQKEPEEQEDETNAD
jgi:CRISPR type I-E-associated protein CasB/Cse2